jgi:replication factor C subunit 1
MNACPWTQLYRPQRLQDIIGHTKAIREIKEWLKNMKARIVSHKNGGASDPTAAPPCPILFLHGPSGVGKTIMMHVILNLAHFNIYELNAGEIRSKKRITNIMERIFNNGTVDMMCKKKKLYGTAIVMDEIDGMSCGDKGGLHQLFSMVHDEYNAGNVTVPVICISNRPYEKKLNSNIYVEIQTAHPTKSEIMKGLLRICKEENVEVSKKTLQRCIDYTSHDMRKAVVFLQELSSFCNRNISDELFDSFISVTQQTVVHSNLFEITSAIFQKKQNLHTAHYFYQTDSSLIPLMIHENIIPQFKYKKMNTREFLEEYMFIVSNLGILSRIKSSMSCADSESVSTKSPTIVELNIPHSSLCCSFNHNILKYNNHKTADVPEVVFTNSLTKSATNSNSHSFFANICFKLNISASYLLYVLPLLANELITTPERIQAPEYSSLTYNDVDKIVQLYSKLQVSSGAVAAINPRCKRIWKKIKSNT